MDSSADSRYEQYPWWVLAIIALAGFIFGFEFAMVPFVSWVPLYLIIGGCMLVVIASLAGKYAHWPLPVAYYGRLIALFGLMAFLGMMIYVLNSGFLSS